MKNIQKEDKAWIVSNTKQYFIDQNLLWSVATSILLIFVLILFAKIFGFSFEWVFLSLLPLSLVFVVSLFIGYNRKWQLKFLKETKDEEQKEKSLQAQIDKIQKQRKRALKLYVLLVDFNQ
ncbi:MAG TPA: hypothetical protein PLQ20_01350 [Candidatus Paceibacterota bacterium]|nr:hypothetical protein [Candidatus Paceibacterota bacterium]